MHLIGRYEKLRALGPRKELTPPYVLDRKWTKLKPYESDEWWHSPDGVWMPAVSGGVGLGLGRRGVGAVLGPAWVNRASNVNTQNLDSAYTFNGGAAAPNNDAIGHRYYSSGSETLSALYFYITAFGGTPGNTNDIEYEVRSGTATAIGTGAAVANGSIDPVGANGAGWRAITGLSVSLSAGFYYFIVGDADGNGTDFATVARYWEGANLYGLAYSQNLAVYSTGGFASGNYTQADWSPSTIVAGFSAGPSAGHPFASYGVSPNDANRRGLYIDGLTAALKVWGIVCSQGHNSISGVEISAGTSATPGQDVLATGSNLIAGAVVMGAIFSTSYTLAASTAYRLVFTYSGSADRCSEWSIGTGADATLAKAMLGGGAWYYARANSTTDWTTNSSTVKYPDLWVLVEDQVVATGGGAPHLTGYGLAGG